MHGLAKGYQGYKSNFGFHVPFDREIWQIQDQKSVFGFAQRNTPLIAVVIEFLMRFVLTYVQAPGAVLWSQTVNHGHDFLRVNTIETYDCSSAQVTPGLFIRVVVSRPTSISIIR